LAAIFTIGEKSSDALKSRPLVGEFAFQFKFNRREDLREGAIRKAKAFFLSLQYAAEDWIALGATKTGVVYRLLGNSPNANE